ncbi:MAG: DUF2268 domain-containing putative Zn-dependent protease [Chloroflexia bacterium]
MRTALERGSEAFTDAGHILPFDRVSTAYDPPGRPRQRLHHELHARLRRAGMIPGYVIVTAYPPPANLPPPRGRRRARVPPQRAPQLRTLHHGHLGRGIHRAGRTSPNRSPPRSTAATSSAPGSPASPPTNSPAAKPSSAKPSTCAASTTCAPTSSATSAASFSGYEPIGLPFAAGYTIGFHLIQSYLQRTGRTIVEATYTPAADIIANSGYFA